jgi:MOSC domain-containing protein YiiM
MQVGILQSVQVGMPQQYADTTMLGAEHGWESSIVRIPSAGPRWLYTTHLEGNRQADTKNHGGLGQAVLLYAAEHYPFWQAELGNENIGPGGFGENFTVEGLSESTSCIGDTYAIGAARIQVTGPRYPCWKIERRWNIDGLTSLVGETGRTGWYCRVLCEGMIEPGMALSLIERPYPDVTVAVVNDCGHGRCTDTSIMNIVCNCPLLADFWRDFIAKQLAC